MFQSPGAVFFKLGPITIRWYGVMIALGFLLAAFVASRLARRWNMSSERIINLALVIFIGGIIGARLYFVILSWSYFSHHLSEIIATWHGGLSIHGGIIGGILVGAIYCNRARLPFLRCADLFACVVPLAQSIGRWGNFFNSEAFGKPVADSFPLKLYIPLENRPLSYYNYNYFHPTFLYESAWDFCLFLILYFVAAEKLKRYPGIVFFLYLAGYSVGRLLIEPLRVDSIVLLNLPAPSVVSAITLALSIVIAMLLLWRYRSELKDHKPEA